MLYFTFIKISWAPKYIRIFSRSRDNDMNIINNTYMLLIICWDKNMQIIFHNLGEKAKNFDAYILRIDILYTYQQFFKNNIQEIY